MDVSDASYYIFIEKKKNKGSQMGHTKKKFKKKWNSSEAYNGIIKLRVKFSSFIGLKGIFQPR